MSIKEKIAMLEEIMELDEGTLSLETKLEEVDEWDSIAAISYIAMLDENFSKSISAATINSFVTVADAIHYME